MDIKTNMEENRKWIQLVIPVIYTLGGLALSVATLILNWEPWIPIIMVVSIAAVWWMHLSQILAPAVRLRIYGGFFAVGMFFYGIHRTSLHDVSIIAAIGFAVYALTEEKSVIRMILGAYILLLIYHLAISAGPEVRVSTLNILRMLLHIGAVFTLSRIAEASINKRKSDLEDYDRMMAELEQVSRRTDDFMTNVSHELRTPINAVTGITSIMIKSETDLKRKTELAGVQRAGHRLFDQIGDILDYTEIDTNKIKLSDEPYMMSSVLNDIVTEIQQLETEDFPEIVINIDPEMPSKLKGDGRRVKKIIRHLLDNAIKFTREGGIYVHVYAMKKDYGVNVCIEVVDTGIGISAADKERIMSGFYQTDSGRSRRAGGIGLGLPIVYGFVKAMGGFVRMESEPGEGTSVYVSIPQRVAEDTPSISVESSGELCLACYLKPDKYKSARVRDFYNDTIADMARGCNLPLHRVSSIADLEKLMQTYKLTHLFIGQEEYEKDEGYFEYLDEDIKVAVSASYFFTLKPGSRMLLMRKPFFAFTVANILNAVQNEDGSLEGVEEKRPYFPGVRALVVDDEEMNLFVAKGIFSDYGMDVVTASGGQEAIDIFEVEEFDIIFMDHMMPEMDGVEAMKILKRRSRDMKRAPVIIALTANAVSGAREMFLEEGFDEFVAKPVEPTELERTLKKVLPVSAVKYRESGEESAFKREEESAEKAEERDDPIEELARKGINIRSGLNYCRGDKDFYYELLNKFALDFDRKSKDIDENFEREDWADYRIRVHALKSSSKMVGADRLSELAAAMEAAAKEAAAGGKGSEYIMAHQEELKRLYHETALKVREALGVGEEAEQELKEIDTKLLCSKLKEIGSCLETFEADRAEALIKEISGFSTGGESVSTLLGDVRSMIEDFDLDSAAQAVNDLVEKLSGGSGI